MRGERAERSTCRRAKWLAAAAVAASCAVLIAPPVPAQASGLESGALNAVSCPSATECIAVGSGSTSSSGNGLTLAERWNGTRWVVQTSPNPPAAVSASLAGVSCTSSIACFAVGSWTAASGHTFVLAERWNGTTWMRQTMPNPGEGFNPRLSGISCASVTACIAVGTYTNSSGQPMPLAERWNGKRWALQSPAGPPFTRLTAVSCTAASACTAVGYGSPSGIAERWDGTTWTLQKTPGLGDMASGGFDSVSCASATACTATGSADLGGGVPVQLADRWNGTIWVVQATPNPGAFVDMAGVSCPSRTDCTAVGYDFNFNTQANETFAMQWNGTIWALQRTPSATDASQQVLLGVSCSSAAACTGVGSSNVAGQTHTLAVRWNGTSWSLQRTP